MITISTTETAALTALRLFLADILPAGIPIRRAQANRVAEPTANDFVLMTPIRRTRLATNFDDYQDCALVGSITANVLTVTSVPFGIVRVGAPVYGTGIIAGTAIVADTGGAGGVGTYQVSPSQTVASRPLYAGVGLVQTSTEVTIQLDVHGPASADNAQRFTTLWRDEYACSFMVRAGFPGQPLYTSDPRQMPFINGEQQYEFRWVIDAALQVNPVISFPLEFADQLAATLIEVDTTYPQ